uniref:Uncharacterized protein n=1 Tax=Parastrongyloides trichosuri TaxID=131310 RepID=A0A0N4Z5N9_PARTI
MGRGAGPAHLHRFVRSGVPEGDEGLSPVAGVAGAAGGAGRRGPHPLALDRLAGRSPDLRHARRRTHRAPRRRGAGAGRRQLGAAGLGRRLGSGAGEGGRRGGRFPARQCRL